MSNRSVQVKATCEQLEVLTSINTTDDGLDYNDCRRSGQDRTRAWVSEWAPSVTSWTASLSDHCGPRCTNSTVLHTPEDMLQNGTLPLLWFCNNTVSKVTQDQEESWLQIHDDDEHVYGTDNFARIAAGAVGWTGDHTTGWVEYQTRTYLQGST